MSVESLSPCPTPDALWHLADRCVKCGLCLPHCPTFRLSQDEGESPRGRIALVQGLLSQALKPSRRLAGHLDRCLGCGACERHCPSEVAYVALLDGLRTLTPALPGARHRRWLARLLSASPAARAMGALTWPLTVLPTAAQAWLARHIPLIAYRPVTPWPFPLGGDYPAAQPGAPVVAIFTGCLARLWDAEALMSAVRVLNRLGFSVTVPAGQVCCGLLSRHHGDARWAARRVAQNRQVFCDTTATAILALGSACAAELIEQCHDSGGPPVKYLDRFLLDAVWPSLPNTPVTCRVAIHEPCSLVYRLNGQGILARFMGRLPGVEPVVLPNSGRCCGGAGLYALTQPGMAARLRQERLDALRGLNVQTLVTANIGCRLHLAAGLAGTEIPVAYPVEWLDRALDAQALKPG